MTNKETFHEMLKQHRMAMTPKARKKSKTFTTSKQWLYPFQWERKYAKEIASLQKLFTKPLTAVLKKNLQGWIDDYNETVNADVKKDQDERWDTLLIDLTQEWLDNYKSGITTDSEIHVDAFSKEIKKLIAAEQKRLNKVYGTNAPKVRAMISGIGINVSKWNSKQFQKFTKEALGVEFFVTEPWEKEVIETWSETNFELIKSLSSEYIKTANTIVSEGVQFGKTYNEIMGEILKLNDQMEGWRARLIARDQVGKLNGALTKRRMTDAGIDMYTWMTANDERVRSKHKTLNNKTMRWDDDTLFSDNKGKTWKKRTSDMFRGIPGQDIQCFLGDTKLTSPVPTQKLFRRRYTGKAAIFTLDNGSTFTCTLNHPVLTGSGTMLPAHLLNVGQDLISISPDRRFSLFEGDQENTIPTFKELFDFSSIISPIGFSSTIGSDFHGDGIVNEKVDIISLENELPVYLKSIIDKEVIEEFLTEANMELAFVPTNSRFHLMFHSLGFAPSSFVSLLCKLLSLRESIITESSDISLRAISKLNTILDKSDSNAHTRDVIFFGQEENTFSRKVLSNNLFYWNLFSIGWHYFMMNNSITHSSEFLREIVRLDTKGLTEISKIHTGNIPIVHIIEKRIIKLSTHVYNLQNSNSWYTITDSGLIVNNCRCTSIPFFDDMINEIDTEIKEELDI